MVNKQKVICFHFSIWTNSLKDDPSEDDSFSANRDIPLIFVEP
jgi:hypothetical protein